MCFPINFEFKALSPPCFCCFPVEIFASPSKIVHALLSNHLYDHGGNLGRWKILICGVKERFDRAETSSSQGRKNIAQRMMMVVGSLDVRMRRF